MELQIKNFGPIKEGTIDLSKKFDLFVGYNNSGKTYVAQMLWAIFHRSTIDSFLEYLVEKNNDLLLVKPVHGKYEISEKFVHELLDEYSVYLLNETIPKTFNIKKNHVILNNCSIKFILKDIKQIRESSLSGYVIGRSNFADEKEADAAIKNLKKKRFKSFEIKKEKDSLTIGIKEHELDENVSEDGLKEVIHKQSLNMAMLGYVLHTLLGYDEPFYLPASRVFYPAFYEYIFRYEKERREEMANKLLNMFSSNRKLEEKDFSKYKSRYTKAMDALMSKIYRLNEKLPEISGEYDTFAEELEKIIGGRILTDREEELAPIDFYFRFENQGKENDLEMYLSSSSVNQLTTLYLFFRYWVEYENNYLIIDEPEENLHPENQINLMSLLVKFSKKANKVLITTHSPLLTKALNNHIYLGILENEDVDIERLIEKEHMDIDAESSLSPDDVGIYFFDGSHITRYEVGEYGVLFSDFKNAERRIREMSEILTDKIDDFDSADED